jgi:hypothetical protein
MMQNSFFKMKHHKAIITSFVVFSFLDTSVSRAADEENVADTRAVSNLANQCCNVLQFEAALLGNESLEFPLDVPHGGTGVSTLTNHGVLLGQGLNDVVVTSAGTSGQVLISGGASADPSFGTLGVSGGGTGDTSLTAYAVVLGGTNTTAPMQQVASVGSSGQALVSAGAGARPAFGTLGVSGGGTGDATLTAYAVLCGGTNTTAPVQQAGAGTSNQILASGGASALPSFKTLSTNVIALTLGTTGYGITAAGLGTYTPSTGTLFVVVETVGGGGGSGGCAGTTNFVSAGAGSGSYSRKVIAAASLGTTVGFTIGLGGTQGASGANAGTAGSNSAFGSLVTAVGGSASAAGAATALTGGAGGTLGTGGVFAGNAGASTITGELVGFSGAAGGNCPGGFGQGGYPAVVATGPVQGNPGLGFGSGASGSCAGLGSAAVIAGSTGAAGAIIITEYILA